MIEIKKTVRFVTNEDGPQPTVSELTFIKGWIMQHMDNYSNNQCVFGQIDHEAKCWKVSGWSKLIPIR